MFVLREIGGHFARVAGSRWLAIFGFDLRIIMLHARWSSNVVLRYVQDTPLAAITVKYRRPHAAARLHPHCLRLHLRGLALLRLQRTCTLRPIDSRAGLGREAERQPPSHSNTDRGASAHMVQEAADHARLALEAVHELEAELVGARACSRA